MHMRENLIQRRSKCMGQFRSEKSGNARKMETEIRCHRHTPNPNSSDLGLGLSLGLTLGLRLGFLHVCTVRLRCPNLLTNFFRFRKEPTRTETYPAAKYGHRILASQFDCFPGAPGRNSWLSGWFLLKSHWNRPPKPLIWERRNSESARTVWRSDQIDFRCAIPALSQNALWNEPSKMPYIKTSLPK